MESRRNSTLLADEYFTPPSSTRHVVSENFNSRYAIMCERDEETGDQAPPSGDQRRVQLGCVFDEHGSYVGTAREAAKSQEIPMEASRFLYDEKSNLSSSRCERTKDASEQQQLPPLPSGSSRHSFCTYVSPPINSSNRHLGPQSSSSNYEGSSGPRRLSSL